MGTRLADELKSFEQLWKDGYFEGDPLNPFAKSSYGQMGFMSVLHATYLRCIKPYINNQTVSLELGPGRGAWTKPLLLSKEISVLDALPEKHNRFYEYLGYPKNVAYYHVTDFDCDFLPDNHFNYMFSFGCLCHVSFEGITKYAVNLYPKLMRGSNCFWMVADYDKYNYAISSLNYASMWEAVLPNKFSFLPLKWLFEYLRKKEQLHLLKPDEDDNPRPGRWYHAGIERTCSLLQEVGYHIVDSDVGTSFRDPIIHFMKPHS